jgi:hypothetical protein
MGKFSINVHTVKIHTETVIKAEQAKKLAAEFKSWLTDKQTIGQIEIDSQKL